MQGLKLLLVAFLLFPLALFVTGNPFKRKAASESPGPSSHDPKRRRYSGDRKGEFSRRPASKDYRADGLFNLCNKSCPCSKR